VRRTVVQRLGAIASAAITLRGALARPSAHGTAAAFATNARRPENSSWRSKAGVNPEIHEHESQGDETHPRPNLSGGHGVLPNGCSIRVGR
jgi:hypothetical protein